MTTARKCSSHIVAKKPLQVFGARLPLDGTVPRRRVDAACECMQLFAQHFRGVHHLFQFHECKRSKIYQVPEAHPRVHVTFALVYPLQQRPVNVCRVLCINRKRVFGDLVPTSRCRRNGGMVSKNANVLPVYTWSRKGHRQALQGDAHCSSVQLNTRRDSRQVVHGTCLGVTRGIHVKQTLRLPIGQLEIKRLVAIHVLARARHQGS